MTEQCKLLDDYWYSQRDHSVSKVYTKTTAAEDEEYHKTVTLVQKGSIHRPINGSMVSYDIFMKIEFFAHLKNHNLS